MAINFDELSNIIITGFAEIGKKLDTIIRQQEQQDEEIAAINERVRELENIADEGYTTENYN